MRFKTWFKKYSKIIGFISASIVFVLSLAKDNIEDARRDVEKIETVKGNWEHGLNVQESQDLRNEWDSKMGPVKTPAEEIDQLGLTNRNNQMIWAQLDLLENLSITVGRSLDTAKVRDLAATCEKAQIDYEDILRLYHSDTSIPPTNPRILAQLNSLTFKLKTESKQLAREDTPKVISEVLSHTQQALAEGNRKLLYWKNGGRFLLVFGFIVNLASIWAGGKPSESAE